MTWKQLGELLVPPSFYTCVVKDKGKGKILLVG